VGLAKAVRHATTPPTTTLNAGDVIHLVHVIPLLLDASVMPPFAGAVPTMLHGGVAKDRATQEAQLWRLRQLRPFSRIMDEAGAAYSFDTIVDWSQDPMTTVGDDLCHAAERLGAAALVLAAHKRGAVLEFLFGSVSSHAQHHCSQPVIVLHPAETRGS
jgi:nucleotide-binding universal stress UspA family protein